MTPFPKVLIAAALVLGAVAAPAQNLQVEGALAHDHVVAPGDQLQDVLKLTNLSDTPVQVRVYQSDYAYRFEESRYEAPGTLPRSNARWITCTPGLLTLGARQAAEVIVQIRVPADQTLGGSYWSMVMVEPQAPATALAPEKDKLVLGIQTVFRYGIQIVTTLGGTGIADVKFVGKRVVTDGAQRRMEVEVENTGERALRPLVWAELHDATGALARRVESEKARLYPGCAQRYKLDLTGVAPGAYTVLAVVDNGDENVFGARYELDLR